MNPVDRNPIRLQLGIASNPPVFPIDVLTQQGPKIWRGSSVAFDIGVFDEDGACVDLSNLDFLEVDIFPLPIPNQNPLTNYRYPPFTFWPFPTTPPAPLVFTTVGSASITGKITRRGWLNGTEQQARIPFSWIDTQGLNLGGAPFKNFWLVVHGKASAQRLVYGGVVLPVYETGAQDIYIPNDLAPLLVPQDTILYVPDNQQMLFEEMIDVEGFVETEGMLIQVT